MAIKKKAKTAKKKKVVAKKITRKKKTVKNKSIPDKVSLSEFVSREGNMFLVADIHEENEDVQEFVRVTSYMYRKLISDINAVSKKFKIKKFELKGILKVS